MKPYRRDVGHSRIEGTEDCGSGGLQRSQEGWTESLAIPIFAEQIIVSDDVGVGAPPGDELPSRLQSRARKKCGNAARSLIVGSKRGAVGAPNIPQTG